MRHLEHLGAQVGSGRQQLGLGEQLDVAGEQHPPDGGVRPEHERHVVHRGAVLAVHVGGGRHRCEHVQAAAPASSSRCPARSSTTGAPAAGPSPAPILSNAAPARAPARRPPRPTDRPSSAAASPPTWSACRWLSTTSGSAVTPSRSRQPSTAPVVRSGVDQHRAARLAGAHHHRVALADVAGHHRPPGGRPARGHPPGRHQHQQQPEQHRRQQHPEPAVAGRARSPATTTAAVTSPPGQPARPARSRAPGMPAPWWATATSQPHRRPGQPGAQLARPRD